MISMQEIKGSRICAEGFTPVMIDSEEAPFIDYGESIWGIYIHHIQDPHFEIPQCCCKPVHRCTFSVAYIFANIAFYG